MSCFKPQAPPVLPTVILQGAALSELICKQQDAGEAFKIDSSGSKTKAFASFSILPEEPVILVGTRDQTLSAQITLCVHLTFSSQ